MKRNKRERDKQTLPFARTIDALNYTPVDYQHSDKFVRAGVNPVEDARKVIAKTNPDNLCDTMLDPIIEAETEEEKIYGKERYIYNVDTIFRITAVACESGGRARKKKVVLIEDRERLCAQRAELETLRKALNSRR